MNTENASPKLPRARAALSSKEEPPIHPDFDDTGEQDRIQKGMPSRTIKTSLTFVAAVLLLGFLFWPKQKNSTPVEVPPPPPAASASNLVEDLVRAQPQPPKIEPEPKPLDQPVPPLSESSQKTEEPSLEDERTLAALLASTDSSDVEIRGGASSKPPSDLVSILAAQQARAERMMGESQEFAERLAQQGLASEAQGASSISPASTTQNGHERFLSNRNASSGLGSATQLDSARSRHALYEGTIIRTVLTRALKTDLPGMVTAKVTTDLYDTVTQKTLLVPRGSEITCSYQSELMVGQELVLAACSRLRLPNGKSFSLNSATASDMQGASGLPAEVNNHFWKMFKTALIVGAASKLLPSSDQQVSVTEGSGSVSTGGTILGTAMNKIIDATIARNIVMQPTGTVQIGTPFTLTLSRDVELEPYLR